MGTTLSHVSIAVPDLDAAIKTLREVYGLATGAIAENAQQGVRLAYLDLGNSRIELMQPLNADSPVGRFLSKNPKGGLHHLCLGVDDVATEARALTNKGVRLLGDGTPAFNVHNQQIAFVHPADFFGALLEIEQHAASKSHDA